MNVERTLQRLEQTRSAARVLRSVPAQTKNTVLREAAVQLLRRSDEILGANNEDLQRLKSAQPDATPAFRDRLELNPARLALMAESLRQVADLPDPVGEVVESTNLANGIEVQRIRAPLGVIFMIFESRPNVAIEAFSLAFKSGNAVILRGGKESMQTTAILYSVLESALRSQNVSPEVLWGVIDPDRQLTEFLLKQPKWIDVVVPRGGDGLIEFVTTNSRIPIIKNDRGLCHVYVDESADFAMAQAIVVNAKTQRPGVCNSMETLLVHRSIAERLLPAMARTLAPYAVEWFGCPETVRILQMSSTLDPSRLKAAATASWDTEYLELKMNCRVVESLSEAIAHIERHGSRHSEAIITDSAESAAIFQTEVDAAAVYWNASTRFTDGFELGLGGELGISTQKLHVRGPVGLRELTSIRWVMNGQGQIRK